MSAIFEEFSENTFSRNLASATSAIQTIHPKNFLRLALVGYNFIKRYYKHVHLTNHVINTQYFKCSLIFHIENPDGDKTVWSAAHKSW